MRSWCMCTKLKSVARDGYSTCSICGGQDAYGCSASRPASMSKVLEEKAQNKQVQLHCRRDTCKYHADPMQCTHERPAINLHPHNSYACWSYTDCWSYSGKKEET